MGIRETQPIRLSFPKLVLQKRFLTLPRLVSRVQNVDISRKPFSTLLSFSALVRCLVIQGFFRLRRESLAVREKIPIASCSLHNSMFFTSLFLSPSTTLCKCQAIYQQSSFRQCNLEGKRFSWRIYRFIWSLLPLG